MAYNQSEYERKSPKDKYDKGKQRSPIPLKPIIILLLLILVGVLIYKYHKPVLNAIGEQLERIGPNDDPTNSGELPDSDDENTTAVAPVDEKELEQYYADKAIKGVDTASMGDNIAAPDNAAPSEPAKPTKPTEPTKPTTKPNPEQTNTAKPEQPQKPAGTETTPATNTNNYNIERFVDQQTNKYGLKDTKTNNILVAGQYDEIRKPRYNKKIGNCVIARKGELWGIININNVVLVPFEYAQIYDWCDKYPDYYKLYKRDYSAVGDKNNTNHLYGLVRLTDGKITVPVEYSGLEYVERYMRNSQGLIIAEKPNKKHGIINMNNEVKLPFEYYSIGGTGVDNCLEIAQRTEKPTVKYSCGLFRTTDYKIIIPLEYEELEVVGPISFIRAKKDGLYGCINDQNQVIVPFQKVNGVGMAQGGSDSSNNRVHFTLPDGSTVCYNIKGEKVPCD